MNFEQRRFSLFCAFCKRNNEPESVYLSHNLKDSQNKVTCPTLFGYRCELCGATGPDAHTRSYCPNVLELKNSIAMAEAQSNGSTPASVSSSTSSNQTGIQLSRGRMYQNMSTVNNSRFNSAGRLRRQQGNRNSDHLHQIRRNGNYRFNDYSANQNQFDSASWPSYTNFNSFGCWSRGNP